MKQVGIGAPAAPEERSAKQRQGTLGLNRVDHGRVWECVAERSHRDGVDEVEDFGAAAVALDDLALRLAACPAKAAVWNGADVGAVDHNVHSGGRYAECSRAIRARRWDRREEGSAPSVQLRIIC